MRLENLTWPQAETYFKNHDIAIVPIGSIECHGKHLPLGTDTLIPNRILELIEEKTDTLIVPTMPYGNTDYLTSFPGTISLGPEVTYQVMYKILDGLYQNGIKKFVVLNGHGGNNSILDRLSVDFEKKGCILFQMNWWIMVWNLVNGYDGSEKWSGGHGGAEETAAIMAINKDLVDYDAIEDAPLKELSKDLPFSSMVTVHYKGVDIPVRRSTKSVTDNGWVGPDHPKYATVEWGEEMLVKTAEYIVDFINVLTNV